MSIKMKDSALSLTLAFLLLGIGASGVSSTSIVFGVTQIAMATMNGSVRDTSGAVIPGATLVVKNVETGLTREVKTDSEGRYSVAQLPVGNYEVVAQQAGFRTLTRRGILLTVGEVAVIDLTLQVGELVEEVEVTADAPIVDKSTPTLSGFVGEREVRALPLNTRSFTNLTTVQPGMVKFPYAITNTATSAQNAQGSLITANGLPPGSITFLMDGVDIADATNRGAPATAAGDLLGVEAIREFNILTHNYDAEYGKSAGAIINYVTKGGTNGIHGTIYEFLRNSALDARNFFDPEDVPPFKRNQFGFAIGGPIIKNRTFFFGNYEGYRQRLTTTKIAIVPDANARLGILPAGRIEINPAVVPYLKLYPLPNGRNFGNGLAELAFPDNQPVDQDYLVTRADHQISSTDSFMARYTFAQADTKRALAVPTFESVNDNRNQYLTLQETKVFSANTVNVFNVGFNRSRLNVDYEPTVNIDPSMLFVLERDKFGIISFGGGGSPFSTGLANQLSALGGDARAPLMMASNVFQAQDKLSYTRGGHSLKAGFQFRRYQLNFSAQTNKHGAYTFTGLEDFLQGKPFIYSVCPLWCVDTRGYRTSSYAWFVTDNWRVNDRLTLTLGLRHEFNTIPNEVRGRVANLDPATDTKFRVGTEPENPIVPTAKAQLFARNATLKQFQPRLGIAYQLFGGKMVIRTGVGIFHNFQTLTELVNQISANPPFNNIALFLPFAGPVPFPHFDEANRSEGGASILAALGSSGLPTSYQWNLSIESEISPSTKFHIDYVGSHISHVGREYEANTKVPQIRSDGTKFFPPGFAPGRLTQWTPGTLVVTGAYDVNADYHALQIGTLRRLSQGLQLQIDYVWSKATTEFEDLFNVTWAGSLPPQTMDPDDRGRDHSLSGINPEHRLTFSYTYELPFGSSHKVGSNATGVLDKLISGWAINGINTIQSGLAMTPLVGFDRSNQGNFGFPTDRPDLAPGANSNPVLGGADRYFDPNAFLLPASGTFGNLGRNTLIGPGIVSLDISIAKMTSIDESRKIEFRAEFFNFPNRTNFGFPNLILFLPDGSRNPAAGRITDTVTTSRQIQFGLKFIF